MTEEIIKQEKTDKELSEYGSKVIDLLEPLNEVEKFKVIDSLYTSLLDVLKEAGIVIKVEKKE